MPIQLRDKAVESLELEIHFRLRTVRSTVYHSSRPVTSLGAAPHPLDPKRAPSPDCIHFPALTLHSKLEYCAILQVGELMVHTLWSLPLTNWHC